MYNATVFFERSITNGPKVIGGLNRMAKQMTKAKIVAALAEKADIPKKTSAGYLEALAALA